MIQFRPILLTLTLILTVCGTSYAESFKAGKHYQVLKKPLPTLASDGNVEVRELFWYYCPHCNNLEPAVDNWVANKPKGVDFVLQPAVFSERWLSGAIFYYVLEELGEVERLHSKLFEAIHEDNIIFNGKADFTDWLALNQVDKEAANKAYSSFNIRTKINKAALDSKNYKVNGVPAFVINGQYTTGVQQAGSEQKLFEVINYLVKKSKQK